VLHPYRRILDGGVPAHEEGDEEAEKPEVKPASAPVVNTVDFAGVDVTVMKG
jgi:hypothetical protein